MADKIKHYARIEFVGQVNDAPEMKYVGSDSIPLATARAGVKCAKKDKGEWKSIWLNFQIKSWREMAEELCKVPEKSIVKITGILKADEWVDKNTGAIRTSFTVEPETIEVLSELGAPKAKEPELLTDSGDDASTTPF